MRMPPLLIKARARCDAFVTGTEATYSKDGQQSKLETQSLA